MRVMIIGGGGREAALAWKVKQSPLVDALFCVPGNAGTAAIAENLPEDVMAIPRMVALAKEHHIDLTIVGPEAPLAAGLVDVFLAEGLTVFGPTKDAAAIETSKVFFKQFMVAHDIPTAAYSVFEDITAANRFSNSAVLGPVVSQPDLNESAISSTSSLPTLDLLKKRKSSLSGFPPSIASFDTATSLELHVVWLFVFFQRLKSANLCNLRTESDSAASPHRNISPKILALKVNPINRVVCPLKRILLGRAYGRNT